MKSFYLKCYAILLIVLLCVISCSKDEVGKSYKMFNMYRETNILTVSTLQKNGQSYRPVHFIVLEYGRNKFYRYEVYNDDAVIYYGIKGLSAIPGYDGWYYDTTAVTEFSIKIESGRFILEDNTALEWILSDDNEVTALKDNMGTVKYVVWKYDEKF